jgi:cytochrome P450
MDAPAPHTAAAHAYSMPLEQLDPSSPTLFQDDTWPPYFERLRREDPVHYSENNLYGGFWSVTKYKDIMAVDTNHQAFSSDAYIGGISIRDVEKEFVRPSFIAMDPPRHDEMRKVVQPIVAPLNLAKFADIIRERIGTILDDLPRDEPFDWVDRVSVELTAQMLATLFDFPFEQRRKLIYWSNIATMDKNAGGEIDSEEARNVILMQCLGEFTKLWNERINAPPQSDLISMMAHGEATRNMTPIEFLGNVILLIVGGNDTTRNSITGGLHALSQNPEQYQKLRDNPGLIQSMVPEIIRWQSPIVHMRRTALVDIELGGKQIKKGDKVIMWYLSGNRDEEVIENANQFIINRPRARQHLAFGFGIHRCVGNRLAEMQLMIMWEEILKRFPVIEVVSEPKRIYSNFIHGIDQMMVRIPA